MNFGVIKIITAVLLYSSTALSTISYNCPLIGFFFNDDRFEDLVRRFEKPDRRNRWDSPLFELFPSRGKQTYFFCYYYL